MIAKRVWIAASLGLALSGAGVPQAVAIPFNDLPSFLAAAGPATLIDFEHDGTGATPVQHAEIGATFAGLGITFPHGNRFENGFGQLTVSGEWGWINDTLVGLDRLFNATFLVPGIRAVGVHNLAGVSAPTGQVLRAFDISDTLIESSLSVNLGSSALFGLVTDVDNARFEILMLNPTGWGLDDLYFSEAKTVSEPGILALLGTEAVFLGVFRRRIDRPTQLGPIGDACCQLLTHVTERVP